MVGSTSITNPTADDYRQIITTNLSTLGPVDRSNCLQKASALYIQIREVTAIQNAINHLKNHSIDYEKLMLKYTSATTLLSKDLKDITVIPFKDILGGLIDIDQLKILAERNPYTLETYIGNLTNHYSRKKDRLRTALENLFNGLIHALTFQHYINITKDSSDDEMMLRVLEKLNRHLKLLKAISYLQKKHSLDDNPDPSQIKSCIEEFALFEHYYFKQPQATEPHPQLFQYFDRNMCRECLARPNKDYLLGYLFSRENEAHSQIDKFITSLSKRPLNKTKTYYAKQTVKGASRFSYVGLYATTGLYASKLNQIEKQAPSIDRFLVYGAFPLVTFAGLYYFDRPYATFSYSTSLTLLTGITAVIAKKISNPWLDTLGYGAGALVGLYFTYFALEDMATHYLTEGLQQTLSSLLLCQFPLVRLGMISLLREKIQRYYRPQIDLPRATLRPETPFQETVNESLWMLTPLLLALFSIIDATTAGSSLLFYRVFFYLTGSLTATYYTKQALQSFNDAISNINQAEDNTIKIEPVSNFEQSYQASQMGILASDAMTYGFDNVVVPIASQLSHG